MLIPIISLFFSMLVLFITSFYIGIFYSIPPSLITFALTYWIIYRKISLLLQEKFETIQKIASKQDYDSAISLLQEISTHYKLWYFSLNKIINGQIGSIYYSQRKFKQAKKYLQDSYDKVWVSLAMLATVKYINKDSLGMNLTFRKVTNLNPENGFIWSLWAYCKYSTHDVKGALSILVEGDGKSQGSDKILQSNILNLKNGKKLKMKPYGEQWYQFQLELPNHFKNNKRIRVIKK